MLLSCAAARAWARAFGRHPLSGAAMSPLVRCLLLATLASLPSCGSARRDADPAAAAAARAAIASTLQRYMVAARAVNADSIASFFAPTAVLLEPGISPVHTRDSIRAFMASFP